MSSRKNEQHDTDNIDSLFLPVLRKTDLVHTPVEEKPEKKTLKQKILPIAIGVFSFFFFVLLFLPLNTLVRNFALASVPKGHTLDLAGLNANLSGTIAAERIAYSSSAIQAEIESAKIQASTFKVLFFNDLALNAEAILKSARIEGYSLQGGIIRIAALLNNIRKNSVNWEGRLEFSLTNSMLNIENLPLVGQPLELPIDSFEVQGSLKRDLWAFPPGKNFLKTNLTDVQFRGTVNFISRALNLEVAITPKEELFQKYEEFALKTMLQNLGYLSQDGIIKIKIQGSLQNPKITPVQSQSN